MNIPFWLQPLLITEDLTEKEFLLQSKNLPPFALKPWSFSQEWLEHNERHMSLTWGWTIKERIAQFYIETETTPNSIQGKTIVDAGCGNGQLTKALALQGANVIGVDVISTLSPIVQSLKLQQEGIHNLCFIQADVSNIPLKDASCDIVISNGVLHHTPNTRNAFLNVARLLKPGGKLYVWLYAKPPGFKDKVFFWLMDVLRHFVILFKPGGQKALVRAYAKLAYFISRKRKGRNSQKDFNTILIDVYDTLTPKYRHYHTPVEVAGWYNEAGFGSPTLTHWKQNYGFGVCATKLSAPMMPAGEDFKL